MSFLDKYKNKEKNILGSQFGGGWDLQSLKPKEEEEEKEESSFLNKYKYASITTPTLTKPAETQAGIGAYATGGATLPKPVEVPSSQFGISDLNKPEQISPEQKQMESLSLKMKELSTRKEQESFCYEILTGKKVDDIFTLPLEERKKALSLMTQLQRTAVTTTEKFNETVGTIGWVGALGIMGAESIVGLIKITPELWRKLNVKVVNKKISFKEGLEAIMKTGHGEGTAYQRKIFDEAIKQADKENISVVDMLKKGLALTEVQPRFAFSTKLYAGLPADEIAKSIVEVGKVSAEVVKGIDPAKAIQIYQALLNTSPALASEFLKAIEKPTEEIRTSFSRKNNIPTPEEYAINEGKNKVFVDIHQKEINTTIGKIKNENISITLKDLYENVAANEYIPPETTFAMLRNNLEKVTDEAERKDILYAITDLKELIRRKTDYYPEDIDQNNLKILASGLDRVADSIIDRKKFEGKEFIPVGKYKEVTIPGEGKLGKFRTTQTIQEETEPAIPTELEGLAEEARKYGSAEEFIKTQKPLYHGTDKSFETLDFGDRKGQGIFGKEASKSKIIFLAEDKKNAEFFSTFRGTEQGRVIDIYLQPNSKIIDLSGENNPDKIIETIELLETIDKEIAGLVDEGSLTVQQALEDPDFINNLKKAGYDGVRFKEPEGKGITVGITNKDILKTKAQLTSIYTQATAGKATTEQKAEVKAEPITAYHITDVKFDKFDTKQEQRFGSHFGSIETTKNVAKSTGKDISKLDTIKVKLDIKNPLRLPDLKFWKPEDIVRELNKQGIYVEPRKYMGDKYYTHEDIIKELQKQGYDGVVYKNEIEGGGDSYIVFEPEQITKVKTKPAEKVVEPEVNLATPTQIKKAHAIAKSKAMVSEKGKMKPQYRKIAETFTGVKSIKDMTPEQAEVFIDILNRLPEPKYRGGKLVPPSIPRTMALTTEGFFQKKYGEPTPIWLLTDQTYYATKLGIHPLVEPYERGKQEFDLEFRQSSNLVDRMINKLNKIAKTSGLEKMKSKVKNIPTKAESKMAELLNKHEATPTGLSPKEEDIFKYFRNLSKDIWRRENEVREKVDLPPIKYKTAYFRHTADAMAKEMLEGKYPFPQGIKYWAEKMVGKKIFNPMEFQRKLSDDLIDLWSKDLRAVTKAMLWNGLKEIYLAQPAKFLSAQLNAISKDLPEYKNLTPAEQRAYDQTKVIPASTKKYLINYINQVIKGQETELDASLNRIVTQSGLKGIFDKVLAPFGRAVGRKPITNTFSLSGRMIISGVMGWIPRQMIRNAFQQTQNLALYGVNATIKAMLPSGVDKNLKSLLNESLFLKSYTGFEELPANVMGKLEKVWLYPYGVVANNNAKQGMKAAYWNIKELIENSKFKKHGWADPQRTKDTPKGFLYPSELEKLEKEMEFGASATQYQYIPMGMPGVFRYKAFIPLTRLQSWWMNYFAKFLRETAHRALKGRPSWAGEDGPTLPWSRRVNFLKYLIIGGAILTSLGYRKSFLLGVAPTYLSPAGQLALGMYNYATATSDWQKKRALNQIYYSWKAFIPGSLAWRDFLSVWNGEKDLEEILFYGKKEKETKKKPSNTYLDKYKKPTTATTTKSYLNKYKK